MPIPEQRVRSVVFEALRRDFGGQWRGLTQAVAWVAIERGMNTQPFDTRIVQIDPADEPGVRRCVEELLEQGVLALGAGSSSPVWPWLSVTPAGRQVIDVPPDES